MADPAVWTIPANGGESIVESYGFRTDILSAWTDAEQRIRQRGFALETLEFGVMAVEAREAQLATAMLFGTQDEAVALPLWQYGSRLSGAVGIGAALLPIADALLVPYRVGGYAVVWRDPFTWELFTVSGVSGAGVATSDLAGIAWAAESAYVFPARRARMPDRVSVKRDSTRIVIGRVRFTMEQDG